MPDYDNYPSALPQMSSILPGTPAQRMHAAPSSHIVAGAMECLSGSLVSGNNLGEWK